MDLRRQALHCGKGCRIDPVSEPRRKSNCSQHSQLVFAEPVLWFADGADDPSFQIVPPADKIQYFISDRIEQQPVDREIPPPHIFPRIATETHSVWMTPI